MEHQAIWRVHVVAECGRAVDRTRLGAFIEGDVSEGQGMSTNRITGSGDGEADGMGAVVQW